MTNEPNIDLHPVADESSAVDQVPVIDIAALHSNDVSTETERAIEQIADACRNWGFFQVVNHGIETETIENLWRHTAGFFKLPLPLKMQIIRGADNPWGFYNNELTKNQRDKKEVFDYTSEGVDPLYGGENQWPSDLPEFRKVMLDWLHTCTRLSLSLLQGMCRGLGLPGRTLHAHFEHNHTGFVRLNHYPVDDPMHGSGIAHQEIADLGVHHHTDAGVLTVLLQDQVGGLQVYRNGF